MLEGNGGTVKTGLTGSLNTSERSLNAHKSKTLSLKECKEISERSCYVNFSTAVLDYLRNDLTRSEKDLWEFLSAEVIFDQDWSTKLSIGYISNRIQRSYRHTSRLIKSLFDKGYVEKNPQSGKVSTYKVRLPRLAADALLSLRARRRPQAPGKNVRGKGAESYYLYNTITTRKKTVEIPAKLPQKLTIEEPIVVDRTAELENLERKLEEISKKITEISIEFIKNPERREELWKKRQELGRIESSIRLKIIQSTPTIKKSMNFDDPTQRIICDLEKMRIERALSNHPNSERLKNELIFSVQRGNFKHRSVPHGISCVLKLVRENRWETPAGFRC